MKGDELTGQTTSNQRPRKGRDPRFSLVSYRKLSLGGWEFMALIATAVALFDLADSLYLFLIAVVLYMITHVIIPLITKFSQYGAGILLVFGLLVVAAVVFTVNKADGIACPAPSSAGPLLPSDFPTPPNACAAIQSRNPKGPVIVYGSGASIFGRAEGHFTLFRAGDHDVVSLDLDKNGVASFNADLYDNSGLILAHIEKNLPTVFGPDVCVKRPDLSSLVVQQRRPFRPAKELLFFHYLNADAFKIRGVFSYPGHPTLEVTEDALNIITGPASRIRFQRPCTYNSYAQRYGSAYEF